MATGKDDEMVGIGVGCRSRWAAAGGGWADGFEAVATGKEVQTVCIGVGIGACWGLWGLLGPVGASGIVQGACWGLLGPMGYLLGFVGAYYDLLLLVLLLLVLLYKYKYKYNCKL